MDYNLLKVFAKVAELGSFTKAAHDLKQPKSRVSRGIARLEDQLQVQLIRRTTRKTSLTASGEDLYKNIYPLLKEVDVELNRVAERDKEMSGKIRITAPDSIAETVLAQIISTYSKKYPLVTFETIITNERLDLTKHNIDIAFRAGTLPDSSLMQRKFIRSKFILVCSQNYLDKHGSLNSQTDLKKHRFLMFSPLESNELKSLSSVNKVLSSDSLSMILQMAIKGDGIAALPEFYCREFLSSKDLIHVLPSWKSTAGPVTILYPSSKNTSQRVKTFIDVARQEFEY